MIYAYRKASLFCAIAATFGGADIAQAEFFVRPVLQYQGSVVDGLSRNDLTKRSESFDDGTSSFQSHVDLADGTIKTYLQMYGPSDAFGGATGVMGDQIRYTGADDALVSLRYSYDSQIFSDQLFTGTPSEFENRYIGIEAHFAVYEAGSGADYNNWTVVSANASKALFVDMERTTFQDQGENFYNFFEGSLGTDLYLTSGKSYDIYAAFNLLAIPGSMSGPITMNSLNTSRIGIEASGGTFTSESGAFLGFGKTAVAAVPEPASWAMMIGGFGFVGGVMRRRSATAKVRYA